jgi:hypothetical protein
MASSSSQRGGKMTITDKLTATVPGGTLATEPPVAPEQGPYNLWKQWEATAKQASGADLLLDISSEETAKHTSEQDLLEFSSAYCYKFPLDNLMPTMFPYYHMSPGNSCKGYISSVANSPGVSIKASSGLQFTSSSCRLRQKKIK